MRVLGREVGGPPYLHVRRDETVAPMSIHARRLDSEAAGLS